MRMLILLMIIPLAACSPKSWTCDDASVLASVREVLSTQAGEQTKLVAGIIAASGKPVDTEAALKVVVSTLRDKDRSQIVDFFDKAFDKSIGKRTCAATFTYKITEAAIPTSSRYEPGKGAEAFTGAYSFDKKTGTVSGPIVYLSQPSSDGAKMLVTVESTQGVIPGAFLFESMWLAVRAEAEQQVERAKRKSESAPAVAEFRQDCFADVKVKAVRLGGMNENEAQTHAAETCGEAATKFESCVIEGGTAAACAKSSYITSE